MIKEIYGHRGARGLFPENTLEGFEKVIQMPIKGIELDIVVSKDEQLVVSHEPWLSHLYCKDLLGEPILASREEAYNLYRMNYDEIKEYDCGSRLNPRFPFQELIPTSKPLLKDVIQLLNSVEDPTFTLLLELKSEKDWYGHYQPRTDDYAKLVVDFLEKHPFKGKLIIQSFDAQLLNGIHTIKPFAYMGLLVDNRNDVDTNLAELDFKPSHYNVYHAYVTEELFAILNSKHIQLIPWTVNSKQEAKRLSGIGVTGIVTDYPDLFLKDTSDLH